MSELTDETLQEMQIAQALGEMGPGRRIAFCLEALVSTLLDVCNVEQHKRGEILDALELLRDEFELGIRP
jgi:hypothetical protein